MRWIATLYLTCLSYSSARCFAFASRPEPYRNTTLRSRATAISKSQYTTTVHKMPKPGFYAVAIGARPGIYSSWDECERQVKGHPHAIYKKFNSESQARAFIEEKTGGPLASTSASVGQPVDQRQTRVDRPTTVRAKRADSPSYSAKVTRRSASPDKRGVDGRPHCPEPDNISRLRSRGYRFTNAKPYHLVVYTDGSGLGNGQKGARAGCGVWWGSEGEALAANLVERVPGEAQTNNRGEILAVIRALETCPFPEYPIEIRTDSEYTINCMTQYLPKWIKNGFLTGPARGAGGRQAPSKVKNVDMIKHLLVLLQRRGAHNGVKFKHVSAHVGVEGNEGADRLAKMGAMKPTTPDREDWLDPLAEDGGSKHGISDIDVEVEVEPGWLLSAEALEELEADLE